ncbi:TIGR03085 family metal-binding protein [Specibacter cremeus]|uniref:TIGR03085 family metal-binding protein n=1 Tax=Specibacter cremeus TaxID=1629051 RepID=UPI000F779533|nr:TIGR03085 family metal-binding protein [Specibacter cremeus]
MGWMETERDAFVDTLRTADPDAPTLCAGWDVRHLLAHVVQREHAPWLKLADDLARRPPGSEKHLGTLVETARTPEGYARLIDRFAARPPAWSPMAHLGDTVYHLEYVIHHEDVRRARPGWEPRRLPAGQQEALWAKLRVQLRLAFRKSPVGVVVQVPGEPPIVVHRGGRTVTVAADPVELALFALGRRAAARLDVTGPQDAVEDFRVWAARP